MNLAIGLEPLAGPGRRRIDQVLAEQIAIGPVVIVSREPQSLQPPLERCTRRPRVLGDLGHDLILVHGDVD